MFGHIYKIKNSNKWHLLRGYTTLTDCGEDVIDVITEERCIGQKGDKYYPDPPIKDVCPICFGFLPTFNKWVHL